MVGVVPVEAERLGVESKKTRDNGLEWRHRQRHGGSWCEDLRVNQTATCALFVDTKRSGDTLHRNTHTIRSTMLVKRRSGHM